MNRHILYGLIILISLGFMPLTSLYADQVATQLPSLLKKPDHPITIEDVYQQILAIEQLMDQFLSANGQTKKSHSHFIIENAQPRDILFEANAFYIQSSLLAFVYARLTYPSASDIVSKEDIFKKKDSLKNSWTILNRSLLILYKLQPILDVAKPIQISEKIKKVTPSDVVELLTDLNQKIDDVGWYEYGPSEAFQEVTQAIYVAEALIAASPDPQSIPSPPPFERNITPTYVFQRLLIIMKILNQVAEKQHIPMIKLTVTNLSDVTISDIYLLSTIIESSLRYFEVLTTKDSNVIDAPYPGWKYPSHVYQRAGILELQMKQLLKLVQKYPNWLSEKREKP